ncbi:hypothetical protein V8C35DRAFT_300616 [Trichoderma chlorosporum]
MSNYGKLVEPVNGGRLSSRTSRAAMPRHTSYTSSKSRQADDWEDWEDDDVVTLIDVDETPSADNADNKKFLFNSAFLDMNASSSAANTRSPSPLESDSVSVSSDEDVTPIDAGTQPGLLAPPPTPAFILTKPAKNPSVKLSMRRSVAKASRPISRKPPKQRNAKLGIKLITDMTKLRRQNHIAGQAKSPARRAPKFVDAAALRALEGSPNPQSVGNWNWLKKDGAGRVADSPLQATRSPVEQLSPEDRPIVIGITLPSDEVTSRGIDPLTATVTNIDTPSGMNNPYPFTFQTAGDRANVAPDPHQFQSVWSPDTPETASSFSTVRYPSSIYSQASMVPALGPGLRNDEVPPVPALPANYKRMTTAAHQRLIDTERRKNAEEEAESGTPCTLFEEDGVTPLKSPASKLSALTPQSVRGWWDHHLVTPFLDKRMSFASRRTQMESPLDERAHQVARLADNKGEQSSMLTPRYVASPQSWKSPLSGVDAKQTFSPATGHEQQGAATAAVTEGGRAILGLSMLEKEKSPSASSSGTIMPISTEEKGLESHSHNVDELQSSDILITFVTDEEVKPLDNTRTIDGASTLASQSGNRQQTISETHDVSSSSKSSTSKEVHKYDFTSTSIELREHQKPSIDSQSKDEPKRDLTPPPRPQWKEAQAPIIRVPTPRQTPPPREGVIREAERPIVVHIEINTGEQKQKFVVDRVAVNSTPTIRIPTPRRTPSTRGDVSGAAVVAESTRDALRHDGPETRDMVHGLGITNLAGNHPAPSASEKRAGDGIKYQAVFPPDHHLHTQLPPREAPLATSTMSTTARKAATSTPASTAASTRLPNTLTNAVPIAAVATTAAVAAEPIMSAATTRERTAALREAVQDNNVAATSHSRSSVLSSQDAPRIEQAQRSTREANSATGKASTSIRTGDASLPSRHVEDASIDTSRSAGLPRLEYARKKQAPIVAHAQHESEQQSRFSVSPTSSKSPDAERGSRTAPRHVRAASNFVSSVLSRQRSPVDQRRGGGDARAVQPIEIMLEEQRDLEAMPKSPERAYITINETHPDNANWARAGSPVLEYGYTEPLPTRPAGKSLSQAHADQLSGKEHKVERKRRRHEKEEMVARRAGGFWRGRGCVPKKGCFGRAGPEGRKKRRIWICIICILLLLIIILAVVLGIVLGRHHGSGNASQAPGQSQSQSPPPPSTSSPAPATPLSSSNWVNLTDYPAMPTGVLTFVGPNNTVAKSDCTEPSTLWSCSLPKDSQASVAPFKPNQPTLIFQIQWDNSSAKAWNVPNGTPPAAISQRDTSNSNSSIDGFNPNPSPPTFQEMWFLGETTDNIQSSQKAGEPTPFFISVLESVNDTVKSPSLSRRATASNVNISDIIFPPTLDEDGTPAPAVMLPNPVQQPVRLFDRGLPTEHYGFYTYFQRTIFLKSVTVLNDSSQGNVPVDEDGGCSETEANHLVTWAETRMLVQIWTRKLNSTASLLTADGSEGIDNSAQLVKPGTMPYPVTVTLDTHGGDPNHKVVWEWPMDDRQKLNTSAPQLLVNQMDAGGTWINHRGSGNAKFGGFDGGTGGCQCQWVNWE